MFGETPQSAADALFWGGLLIVGFVILGAVAYVFRRLLLSSPAPNAPQTWSLQHLRDLRDKGQITQEEFDALREKLLARHGAGRATTPQDAGNAAQE